MVRVGYHNDNITPTQTHLFMMAFCPNTTCIPLVSQRATLAKKKANKKALKRMEKSIWK